MDISIIVIGDELLIGQVSDTNSGDIERAVEPLGWNVSRVVTVHDDAEAITEAVERELSCSRIVLTTGGLGPTKDDITKKVLANVFGGEMVMDPDVLAHVRRIMAERGVPMNDLTATQAIVPSSCTVIPNDLGTAPVMWFERPDGHVLVAMPGVPFETQHAFSAHVLPKLRERFASGIFVERRCVITAGISESAIAEQLDEWEKGLPKGFHLAYLPQRGLVRLRLDGSGPDREILNADSTRLHGELVSILKDAVVATDDLTPAQIVVSMLIKRGLTVVTAESCTGGTIASMITSVAGCSQVMKGGVVAYSNEVKASVLGVSESTLAAYGAVSEPVVDEMLRGAQKALNADVAIATSGIAGPGGAVPGKPVGTVVIGVALKDTIHVATCHFPGSRASVVERASVKALLTLIHMLK